LLFSKQCSQLQTESRKDKPQTMADTNKRKARVDDRDKPGNKRSKVR
jgi:hypothetical protein